MRPLGIGAHEYRAGGVVSNRGACNLAGPGEGLVGVVHYHLLAEGVDEVPGAPRDLDPVGREVGESHGIAYHIAP